MKKPVYVLIGGFLGAGKTTFMIALARYLAGKNASSALITNDQSVGLVDTARVRQAGFPVKEVTGSCFCCNFNGLLCASEDLVAEDKPEYIIAEPVGSCTDLKATISYPLAKLHADDYGMAALTVIVDPMRFGQVMGLMEGRSFSEKVLYIYQKQLEEAEIIIINKVDLLLPDQIAMLSDAARKHFPRAKVFEISCLTGEGTDLCFEDIVSGHLGNRPAIEVNYDTYAEGEALLGWVNTSASFIDRNPFDGDELLVALTRELHKSLADLDIEIAHLKTTFKVGTGEIGSVSLTRTDTEPQVTDTIGLVDGGGTITINLRAEADPKILRAKVHEVLRNHPTAQFRIGEIHAFRPGRPTPTFRMASLA